MSQIQGMAHRLWQIRVFQIRNSPALSELQCLESPGVKKILLPSQESPSSTRLFGLTHQGLVGLPGFIFQLEKAPFQLFLGSLSLFSELLLPGQPLALHLEGGRAIFGGIAAESHPGLSEMHQQKKGLLSSWDGHQRCWSCLNFAALSSLGRHSCLFQAAGRALGLMFCPADPGDHLSTRTPPTS